MKDKKVKIIIALVVVLLIAVIGIYFYMRYKTYDYMEITKTYEDSSTDNVNYIHCMEGVLRYSRDGVALLNTQRKESWNQPCQMSNPIVEICDESVAVADKGGTTILVFEEKGLKGEIHTTRPIEKISVSSQGIVCAILKDEQTPLVMCYDAKGNVLVGHEVSLSNMGYPIDVAISKDGNTLLVSYLYTDGTQVGTKIAYYYFGDNNTNKENYLVHKKEMEGTIVPTTAFLKKNISLLVTDHSLIFYKGLETLEEFANVEIKNEIKSVAYNDKIVAALIKNGEKDTYTLKIYTSQGKELSSTEVEKEYASIKAEGKQVVLYDGQMCSIYTSYGVKKYEGKVEENIIELFPISGLNKYLMINASGFHEVQLEN